MISFVFPGEPVAAARPRVTARGTFTPAEYRVWKNTLTTLLRVKFAEQVQQVPPTRTNQRTKWIKQNRYHLDVTVYRSKNVGDIDNFYKGVADALEDAGILANDSQIDLMTGRKLIDKRQPRVEFTLIRLPAYKD